MKTKLFSFLLAICLCFTPFVLTGCLGTGGGGGNGGDGGSGGGENESLDMNNFFYNTALASVVPSDTVDEEIKSQYTALGNSILAKLEAMYGKNGIQIRNEDYSFVDPDTSKGEVMRYRENFKDAMKQDGWAWGNTDAEVFSTAHKNIFIQNLFEATLGLNISNSYLESSLMSYAGKVDHKGFFYYEADAIAEYILNSVIGTSVVTIDNEKFFDVNNNGTFDYYFWTIHDVNVRRVVLINNIKDFNNTNPRATASNKSTVWNTINFGEGDFSTLGNISNGQPAYDNQGLSADIIMESGYDYNGIVYSGTHKYDHRFDQYDLIKYQRANPTSQRYWDVSFKAVNASFAAEQNYFYVRFSCFKNYVNNVYSMVYEAIEELAYPVVSKANYAFTDINNLGVYMDDETDGFNLDAKNYKSFTLLAKQKLYMDGMAMMFELDPSISESVTINVIGNYSRMVSGEQVSTKAKLGTVIVKPGAYNINGSGGGEMTFSAALATDDNYGVQATEFYPLGITNFELNPANPLTYLTTGKYEIGPSSSFLGSTYGFKDDNTDFFELIFEIATPGFSDAKFKFAVFMINFEENAVQS